MYHFVVCFFLLYFYIIILYVSEHHYHIKTASVALVTIFSFVTSGCLLVRDMHCQVNEACVVPMI